MNQHKRLHGEDENSIRTRRMDWRYENEPRPESRPCPNCGKKMYVRVNRKDNSKFWGCSGYHDDGCHVTAPYKPS